MVDFSMMVAVVMINAQLLKKIGFNPQTIPLMNVLFGLILSILCFPNLHLLENIQQGLLIGLSASGVYDVCMGFKKQY